MKKITIILLALFTSIFAFSADEPKEIKSKIKAVTIFAKGAQVSRTATASIPVGTSQIKFIGIASSIDKNSIQVKADGDFTVMSVVHQLNYFEPPIQTEAIEKLQTEKQTIQDKIEDENTILLVLSEEESLILSNKTLGGDKSRMPVDQLKATAEFYKQRIKELRLEKLAISRTIKGLNKQVAKIQTKIAKLSVRKGTNTSEVVVAISSKVSTSGKFTINYLVNNAGWTPLYDLRVKDVSSPVQLVYKANVYQTSGEEWDDVMLTLSTGDPSQGGTKPTLYPWQLSFYNPYVRPVVTRGSRGNKYGAYNPNVRTVTGVITDVNGETLIGASVLVKGTSTGAVTDIDGRFRVNIPNYADALVISYTGYGTEEVPVSATNMNIVMDESATLLNEVVVTGYGAKRLFGKRRKKDRAESNLADDSNAVPVQEIEQATSVNFKIDIPYDIPTDGKPYLVQIKAHELPAYYEYFCAPKLDTDAFLTAQVTGWESYNLLNGEASLFFEGTYLGKSFLDVQSVDDTLDLSLGRDKNIVVKRTRQKQNTKKKFLSNKRVDTRAWDIEVRNKKKFPINIVIEDQIPVAITEEIEVEKDFKGAEFDKDTGKLTWKFELPSKQTKKMDFKYTVKYPKKKTVTLE